MIDIDVLDYRPGTELDAEIAALVFDAVRGWPDHGPIAAPLVRSSLRATGTSATTMVLHRGAEGSLDAVSAIRWPATLEAVGRVWGPLVRPTSRGRGVARSMVDTISQVVAARPGVRVCTAPIPATRTCGWSLFERAGWLSSGTSSLLTRPLPAEGIGPAITGSDTASGLFGTASTAAVSVRSARQGEYLDQALATLFAAVRPETGYATARDTFQRWASDVRYVPDGLLLTESDRRLTGAALVYHSALQARSEPGGRERYSRPADDARLPGQDSPPEAVLAELLVAPDLAPNAAQAVRAALVMAALQAGSGGGAEVARAESRCPFLIATLKAAGFQEADEVRYYTPPTPVGVG